MRAKGGNYLTKLANCSNPGVCLLALLLVGSVGGCGGGGGTSASNLSQSNQDPGRAPIETEGFKQTPVNLGNAATYVILSKSGISTVPTSAIIGSIGVSPIAATAITGFSLSRDSTGTFSTSTQVTGRVFAADYKYPTPTKLTAAISDMEHAYTDAAGRPNPDHVEFATGAIGGLTLAPGLYKWSSTVTIDGNVTLKGNATDVWIFQIAGDLTEASGARVILKGGAVAKNIFWQVAGGVEIGTTAHIEGEVLSKTLITLNTGASAHGRLLAQTAVTLKSNAVEKK